MTLIAYGLDQTDGSGRPLESGEDLVDAGGNVLTLAEEKYLEFGVFDIVSSSGVNADTDAPDLGSGDVEVLDHFSSTTSSGRVDVVYQGRLASFQSSVTQIRVLIKGTGASPQYRLYVYAENSGGSAAQVYDSGLTAAPGTLTETLLTSGDLSSQPLSSKRYHVLVEAYLDNGEDLFVSRPFVRQE